VIRRPTTAPVALAAAATVALVAIDVARQVDLGVADAGLWFFAASTCVGIGAASASVAVARSDGHLVVEVSDDGRGGAVARLGGGLEGLVDRVGALDGRLTIDSAPAAGTTIRADIPCASS
jgi:hypothetical protein